VARPDSPGGIITSVLVILIPMPSFLMDILLAANITIAVIVLLTTITCEDTAGLQHLSVAATGHHVWGGWC
jgi:flagellar biosynthesis component FlhA